MLLVYVNSRMKKSLDLLFERIWEGNSAESMLSTKLYSDALKYGMESFRAFESAACSSQYLINCVVH